MELAVLGFGAYNHGRHQLNWSSSWKTRFYACLSSQMKEARDLIQLLRRYLDLLRPRILYFNLTAIYNYSAWIMYWIMGDGCG